MSNAGQGISEGGFLAVLWTLTAVSTLLLAGRIVIRSVLVKSFHLDDGFSILAYVFLLANAGIATRVLSMNYHYGSILIGETPMPDMTTFAEMTITLRKWNVAAQMLFWTSLFCVKFSFMFLYRHVLAPRGRMNAIWWAFMVFIAVSFGVCLIGVFGQCGHVRNLFTFEGCNTPSVAALTKKEVWIDFAFNVATDLIVIIFPLPVIWGLHMPASQKLAVTGICSLAIITIAFETVRTVKLHQLNSNLTNLYSYLELLVSVVVGMLPSYRFMVSPSEKDREYRRLFWNTVTMRTSHSNSSGYTMPDYGNERSVRPSNSS